jgi:hypothetical protein
MIDMNKPFFLPLLTFAFLGCQTGLILLLFTITSTAQTSAATSKPDLFDEKFTLIPGSYIHAGDSILRLNESKPIRINKVSNDTIFIGFINNTPLPIDHAVFTLVKPTEKMYLLTSDGMDKIKFSDWDISPLIIPIKIRPRTTNSPLQFISDVSIGPYFGHQRGSQSYSALNGFSELTTTYAIFASPTLVRLDPTTVSKDTTSSGSVLGFTVGAGILFNIANYQLGLVAGLDWISGAASETWIYQGKPWYSFSFAYNLSNQ